MGRLVCTGVLAAFVFCLNLAVSAAEDDWKAEFDRVCGQTDRAGELATTDLKKALASCDSLQPRIEALESTPRKIYLKRLQMCRNLYRYLLEGREKPEENK